MIDRSETATGPLCESVHNADFKYGDAAFGVNA